MADVVPISDKLREAREATLRRHLDAHNAGDIDGVLETFSTPRVELVPSSRVLDGADAVRAYLTERLRSFPDQRFETITLHHSDDAVISEYWMTATLLGEVHGVEPTGKRFKARMAAIFDFDGDRISSQRLYFDSGTIARQLA